MYRKGELVEVRNYTLETQMTSDFNNWIEIWQPGVIVQWHGKQKMRTGIARFEELEVVSVLVNGKVRKIPTKNLRYPKE